MQLGVAENFPVRTNQGTASMHHLATIARAVYIASVKVQGLPAGILFRGIRHVSYWDS